MRPVNSPRVRGAAMILVMSVVMLLAALATAILLQSTFQSRAESSDEDAVKALFIGEAGISDGIASLDSGGTGNLGSDAAPISFSRGSYYVVATPNTDGTTTLVSTASFGKSQRKIEVVLKNALFLEAAMTVFGKPLSTQFQMNSQKSGIKSRVDGLPDMVPALQIQNTLTMNALVKEIKNGVSNGTIDANSLTGDPLMYFPSGKTNVGVAVQQKDNPTLNGDLFDKVHDALYDKILTDMLKAATVIDKAKNIPDGTQFGTTASPQTTLISGHGIVIQKGTTVTGSGTLIVSGDMLVEGGATFKWDGNIIVLGGKDIANPADGKSKFENHHGDVSVNGNVFLLGHEKGSAEFKILEQDDQRDGFNSKSNFNGSVYILPGELAKKAKVTIDGGDTTINGLVVVNGHDRTEFKLKDDDKQLLDFDGTLTVKGAVALGSDTTKKGVLNVNLKGDTLVQYDRKIVDKQLSDLANMLKSMNIGLPLYFLVQSWRELL